MPSSLPVSEHPDGTLYHEFGTLGQVRALQSKSELGLGIARNFNPRPGSSIPFVIWVELRLTKARPEPGLFTALPIMSMLVYTILNSYIAHLREAYVLFHPVHEVMEIIDMAVE